ncbi:hypothetical protein [Pandoraea captiosa]|jgi:hypothetical protein|uniref:hypothetical protein n=1 Tax=Pandoraea captiosa TaxID=2508302 RepID=UPI001241A78B|nr:hypothetical protein [Pandoraea captiosa]
MGATLVGVGEVDPNGLRSRQAMAKRVRVREGFIHSAIRGIARRSKDRGARQRTTPRQMATLQGFFLIGIRKIPMAIPLSQFAVFGYGAKAAGCLHWLHRQGAGVDNGFDVMSITFRTGRGAGDRTWIFSLKTNA